MERKKLLHILTGTEDPLFLTERENVLIDKFLGLIEMNEVNQKIKTFEMFKLLVVRGCFRGNEHKAGRNYEVAIKTLKEECQIDYEEKIDESV